MSSPRSDCHPSTSSSTTDNAFHSLELGERPTSKTHNRLPSTDSDTLQEIEYAMKNSGPHHHHHEKTATRVNSIITSPSPSNPTTLRRKTRALWFAAIASTGSSLVLSFVALRSADVPLALLPLGVYVVLFVGTRLVVLVAGWKGIKFEGVQGIGFNNLNQVLRYEAPLGVVVALSLWCRAEAAARLGIGMLQALEVFAAPLVALLSPQGHDGPSRTHFSVTLLSLSLSVALMSQTAPLPSIALGLLATLLQSFNLLLLKRCYKSHTSTSAFSAIHHSAPFAFIVGLAVFLLAPTPNTINGIQPTFGDLPRIGSRGTLAVISFVILKAMESFGEALALEVSNTAVGTTLLSPARNFATLILAPITGIATGLTNAAQMAGVYVLGMAMTVWADYDVRSALGPGDKLPLYLSPISATASPQADFKRSMFNDRASSPPRSSLGVSGMDFHLSPGLHKILNFVAFGQLLVWLLQNPVADPRFLKTLPRSEGTFDIVYAYHSEPMDKFVETIQHVKRTAEIAARNPRVLIYVKHETLSLEELRQRTGANEVIRLKNEGREADTYLNHIMRHYNSTLPTPDTAGLVQAPTWWETRMQMERVSDGDEVVGLADHTLFMQPHLSWHWLGEPRLEMFDASETGFLSLGPYFQSDCGEDGRGNGRYDRMKDIYTIFHETFCPAGNQLASYAGQFIVSRKRILANSYSKYSNVRDLLIAPEGHWLHDEGWWFKWQGSGDDKTEKPDGPKTPFLGHALERSWPAIFHCDDPKIAESCHDDVRSPMGGKDKCQCFD